MSEEIIKNILAAALDWATLRKRDGRALSCEEQKLFLAIEEFRIKGGVSLDGKLVMVESQFLKFLNGKFK